MRPDGSFETRILAIRQPHPLFEVKGKGMPSVYFYAQNIKAGEYVNCFLCLIKRSIL